VKGISVSAEEDTIVTIIGSNGAGKTTTLRAIIGLKTCSAGEILFRNYRIDGKLPQDIVKLGIGFVPAGRDLFPYMSVLENLRLGAFLLRDRQEIDEKLEALFKHFPVLKERKQQQAKTLSGGEQQILAIARTLMGNPKLLLLDEPSLGLSPMNVKEIGRIVHDINERGVGVVLVEQNARLALKLAHKCYVLETGSIVLEGDPKELLHSERVRKAYLGE
jgi:branched-chain amino acid transport system ATP-binding protein